MTLMERIQNIRTILYNLFGALLFDVVFGAGKQL